MNQVALVAGADGPTVNAVHEVCATMGRRWLTVAAAGTARLTANARSR